jgi:mono/diheme cytochrome c family protein
MRRVEGEKRTMRKKVMIGGALGAAMLTTAAIAQVTAPAPEVMTMGQTGYTQNCQGCHGANGEGGMGFRLDGNPIMSSSAGVVQMIIQGYLDHGMPPFGHLSNDMIAAIATYVRNSWSNSFGQVPIEVVVELRAAPGAE